MRIRVPPGLVQSLDASDACVHVWIGRLSPQCMPPWVHDGTLLDASERETARRFRRLEDRTMFLASHAALRLTLATYIDTAAHELAFETGSGGRGEEYGAVLKPPEAS